MPARSSLSSSTTTRVLSIGGVTSQVSGALPKPDAMTTGVVPHAEQRAVADLAEAPQRSQRWIFTSGC